MARTLPAPYRDRVIGEDGMLSPAWVEYFEQLTGVSGYVFERPTCSVYFTADQSIADATEIDVTFDSEDHDNADFHSTTTNTDRITIPEEGAYAFGAHLLWDSNATGYRQLRISLNDAAPVATAATLLEEAVNANAFPGNFGRNFRAGTAKLSAGDILRVVAEQTSGGPLDALGTTASGPRANAFWCFKIANAVR